MRKSPVKIVQWSSEWLWELFWMWCSEKASLRR